MSSRGGAAGKRAVQKSTVDRWIAESDKSLNTSVWLTYDTDCAALKCSIYVRFRDRLVGRRNYSAAYIEGSANLRASSYKEHAASEMHARAMLLLKKQVCTYIAIATINKYNDGRG